MTVTPLPILRELPEELLGERVQVRPLRAGDGAALWEAVQESRNDLSPWLPWLEKTQQPADCETTVRRAAARWLTREDLMVGIWHRQTGIYLGGSGLHRIRWDVPSFEIGYWLRSSAWRQGYVTETVRLLCALAIETLGGQRVEIRCDARNARSAGVPLRCGFVQEACLRNESRDGAGHLRDTLIFALTPADYAQHSDSRRSG